MRIPGEAAKIEVARRVAFRYPSGMSQPVKLSDALVLEARLTAPVAQRSIAGQIEFWAGLGRAVEPLLRGREAHALRKSETNRSLSESLGSVETPEGHRRVADYLQSRPFPHYEAADGASEQLIQIEENGRRRRGRFINRRFVPTNETDAA